MQDIFVTMNDNPKLSAVKQRKTDNPWESTLLKISFKRCCATGLKVRETWYLSCLTLGVIELHYLTAFYLDNYTQHKLP